MIKIIYKDIYIFLYLLCKNTNIIYLALMFSQSAKYAILAVLYLTTYSDKDRKKGITEISEKINVPTPFLAKLLQELSKKGFINSTKGRGGGFYMSEENKNLSILDLIEEIEGKKKLTNCVLGSNHCNANHPCALHNLVYEKNIELLKNLKGKPLYEYAKDLENGTSFL